MRAEKQDAPVLSRWMKVLLGVSLAVLLAAAAVIGVAMHDRAAYPRVLEQICALDADAAERTLHGVIFFHDADEPDYVRLTGLALQTGDDAYAVLSALEDEPFPAAFGDACAALEQGALDALMAQARAAYEAGDTDTALRDFELLCERDYDAACADWLLLARVRSGCTMSALAALYGETQDAVLTRLTALLPFADCPAAILSNAGCAEAFLTGRWTSADGKSLTLTRSGAGYQMQTDLLDEAVPGRFFLRDGVYSVGADEASAQPLLRFEIVDAGTLRVTRVSDGRETTLTRT